MKRKRLRVSLKPLQEFLRLEAAGGLVLMASAALAMLIANSPLADEYVALFNIPISVSVGSFKIAKPLLLWVNDGLMAVFFFLIGLELKRELLEGHLSSLRQASLPAFAAVGGMAFPSLFYSFFNWGDSDAIRGWAIPAATDIAFALGVLSLLGKRVPSALKAFLLSVAIFDDLGAIIAIALFYTEQLSLTSLLFAVLFVVFLAVVSFREVKRPAAYLLLGIPLWVAVLKSGVHATLAGVIVALFIPLRTDTPEEKSMLKSLEHSLHPWVAFGVLPIFAFANAGVPVLDLAVEDIINPVPLGIIAGLFLGKPIGIVLMSWLATVLRLASLPEGVRWKQLHGVGLLSGIGFTMSLFVSSLAFDAVGVSYSGLERLGILVGSLASGLVGYVFLRAVLRDETRDAEFEAN